MKERQKHTAFLRHCIRFDNHDGRHQLEEELAQAQQDERCLRRAIWLMVLFASLALAGVCYAAVFLDSFPFRMSQFVSHWGVKFLFALGAGSVVSLLVFTALLFHCRRKLNHLHEECRRSITRILQLRLPDTSISSRNRPGAPNVQEMEAFAGKIPGLPEAL
jgi:hypothetical protein